MYIFWVADYTCEINSYSPDKEAQCSLQDDRKYWHNNYSPGKNWCTWRRNKLSRGRLWNPIHVQTMTSCLVYTSCWRGICTKVHRLNKKQPPSPPSQIILTAASHWPPSHLTERHPSLLASLDHDQVLFPCWCLSLSAKTGSAVQDRVQQLQWPQRQVDRIYKLINIICTHQIMQTDSQIL